MARTLEMPPKARVMSDKLLGLKNASESIEASEEIKLAIVADEDEERLGFVSTDADPFWVTWFCRAVLSGTSLSSFPWI